MLFQSTRGKIAKISFEEAIIKGIADDGGLYVPERVPKAGPEFIESLVGMDYAGAAAEIIKLFTDNFTDAEIADCVTRAYNERSFCRPEVTPLRKLDERVSVMELYHGPTAAFKDVALQLLPPMLTYALKKTGVNESIAILVATSGDTGKAALEGFSDVPGTVILVFYPKDGVSEAQKLQMITQEGRNVSVAAVEGNFDDAQTGVKAIFADADSNARLRERGLLLSSANSINWGRLMPQIVYYFRAYTAFIKAGEIKNGDQICFAVPTGNFGNILAGWYAREMGLPVSKFICASNSNNVLADFIRTGVYDKNRDFLVTMSPAMDILISSNLERLLYELSGRDSESVKRWMGELAEKGRYDIGTELHKKIKSLYYGGYASEDETSRAINDTYTRYGYLVDTHTAVGIHVYGEYEKTVRGDAAGNKAVSAASGAAGSALSGGAAGNKAVSAAGSAAGNALSGDAAGNADHEKVVVLSTASPYKFAKDVYLAIADSGAAGADPGTAIADSGAAIADPGAAGAAGACKDSAMEIDEIQYIGMLSELSGEPVPESLNNLRGKPPRHLTETSKENMKDTALRLLTALGARGESNR